MNTKEPPQMYEHTFEIKVKVTSISTDPNLSADVAIQELMDRGVRESDWKSFPIRRVKVSPNIVPYSCPTDGCDLIWRHKVSVDNLKDIPAHCAYCARKSRAAISGLQRDANALGDEFLTINRDLSRAMIMNKFVASLALQHKIKNGESSEEELARIETIINKGTEFRLKVDLALCQLAFEKVGEIGEVKVVIKEVPLVKGTSYTV